MHGFKDWREALECLTPGASAELIHQTVAAAGNVLFETEEERAQRLASAEKFIRDQSPLYRHYCIPEVQAHTEQFTGQTISRGEAINIVQSIRDELDMGPIHDSALRRW
jgi:hypothetical protein